MFNGFGDGLAAAFELAVTPLVFGGLGLLVDRRLGVTPLFTIVLFLVALVAKFVVMWSSYEQRMRAEEAKAPWRHTPARRVSAASLFAPAGAEPAPDHDAAGFDSVDRAGLDPTGSPVAMGSGT